MTVRISHITPVVRRIVISLCASAVLRFICVMLFALVALSASAQEERGLTRDGNKLFTKGKYADAEAAYKKALEKKNNFPEAVFNLGDAIYKQKRYDDAIAQFEQFAKTAKDPKQKAQAYHNLGNAQLDKEEYQKAVDAYKQALKLNPEDRDTRYNMAYANVKLRQQQQQNQQNKNNKKDNKDQNKDKKDQDKKDQQNKGDKDKKDNKDQKDKDQQGKGDKDKPQPKPGQEPKLTKEQAEKLLEALKAEEQKAQDKMQKKAAKPVEVQIEKDW